MIHINILNHEKNLVVYAYLLLYIWSLSYTIYPVGSDPTIGCTESFLTQNSLLILSRVIISLALKNLKNSQECLFYIRVTWLNEKLSKWSSKWGLTKFWHWWAFAVISAFLLCILVDLVTIFSIYPMNPFPIIGCTE